VLCLFGKTPDECYVLIVLAYPIRYTWAMNIFHRTERFSKWLKGLKDPMGRASVLRRIERAESQGNFGNHQSVDDKSSQMKDIELAKEMAADIHGQP